MTPPLLSIRELHISFAQPRPAVEKVDLNVHPGEILALVGESGSGKSMTARAVIGLLPPGATASGSIRLGGEEIIGMDEALLNTHRGRTVALIFQDPQSALNPVRRIGWQIGEAIRSHNDGLSGAQIRQRAVDLLTRAELSEPEALVDKYPHQLSGGQKQRVAIALALANDPALLIADEPTTALDVTVQQEILTLLRRITRETGTGILLITHNMGVVARYADRVAVLRQGRILEENTTAELFAAPQHPYTRQLLDAVPVLDRELPAVAETPTTQHSREGWLEFRDLSVTYPAAAGNPAFTAVEGVTLTVPAGRILGLVGESGSGKTTLGRVAAGLVSPSAGTVRIGGQDPAALGRRQRRSLGRDLALIPQDPAASLNPRRTVAASIREPLDIHGIGNRAGRHARVLELLDAVSLPTEFADRYPDELSGGQRQRVAIARALTLSPTLVIADEPTSALDVSVQAAIIALFRRLQAELGFAAVFISHDLAVIGEIADEVAVLRRGRLIEHGPTGEVFASPHSDYTRKLLDAVPVIDRTVQPV